MTTANYISKVAIVGAGGNSGRFITEALLKTKNHTITALTRPGSQSKLPEGVFAKPVDYDDPDTLVNALCGQDALVITLFGGAPPDTEEKLIRAAGEAGVKWILPNEWCPDTENEALVRDVIAFQSKPRTRSLIKEVGKSSYIALCTGYWYEWSLAKPGAFGFDFVNRRVLFFDDGNTRTSMTTWPQLGRAVASLLSLPITPDPTNPSATSLHDLANKLIYVNSFTVSQRDMFSSVLRVTDTQESDWSISYESSQERYNTGLAEIKAGNFAGFTKLGTRVFFQDGCGDFESSKGTLNEVLGLPNEDLDEATDRAIERAKNAAS